MRFKTYATLIQLILFSLAMSPAPALSRSLPDTSAIDAEVTRLMARERVNGVAVALVDRGKIRHVGAYGFRNVEKRLPLTPDTIMYGASITKAASAYLVMQLVDEGRIKLDAPISRQLLKPLSQYKEFSDLVGDPRADELTPRHILNHATGFANFRWLEPDEKLRFHRDPGERYGYSGEGFYILQLLVEETMKKGAGALMQERVFDPVGMMRTSMQWRADFAENLADGYRIDGAFEPHDERSRARMAGSMDTTIADQAKLWAAVVRGDKLSNRARKEFARGGLAIESRSQFPTLAEATDPRGKTIGLSAALGVVTFNDPSGAIWFKGGHNDTTGNMLICQERRKRCVIFLGNDVRAEKIYPELARFILGDIAMPWWWEYGL
jgi:CubicO group peptidase (beta-lactamase class C family)